jgi:hypothetical protein
VNAYLVSGMAFVSHATVPPKEKQPTLYFPLKVGTTWVYQRGDEEITKRITQAEKKGDKHIVTVSKIGKEGLRTVSEIVEVSERGLRYSQSGEHVLDPPVWMLKTPFIVGDTWDCSLCYKGEGSLSGLATIGRQQKVEVPAGEFMAVPVVRSYESGGEPFEPTSWFCVGVGEVQDSFSKLKSFTLGK